MSAHPKFSLGGGGPSDGWRVTRAGATEGSGTDNATAITFDLMAVEITRRRWATSALVNHQREATEGVPGGKARGDALATATPTR